MRFIWSKFSTPRRLTSCFTSAQTCSSGLKCDAYSGRKNIVNRPLVEVTKSLTRFVRWAGWRPTMTYTGFSVPRSKRRRSSRKPLALTVPSCIGTALADRNLLLCSSVQGIHRGCGTYHGGYLPRSSQPAEPLAQTKSQRHRQVSRLGLSLPERAWAIAPVLSSATHASANSGSASAGGASSRGIFDPR